ncbi:MAG: calcineurin-like phosphoesterase family protein [Candidatus Pedobacter colombiensis]|uniref:Calcineurin-like phosphoesterase family protein n=1 Tax=Candidatus Pedobacter colombiensis TaxID=3121371 RepID=A0AAJ6B7F3_9SPHI|nr:calcineurin-like phosphoesterase family protein [Pedobacter sp.]WEK19819.1 MAG: calcineurin-like phosphoesterase family protein [Pedobacter sp.]
MNRRSFIQSMGLITGGAFISLQTNAFSKLNRDKIITGTVSDGKKGIANVVISDGYSVVVTDARGNYTLTPDDKASTIFMSTPSGYEFKADYNVTKQYETLGSRNSYNFKLKALKRDDNKHNFIIWADPQVKTKKDVKQMMDTSVPDVQQLVKSMGPDALIHGICVGDIVWDNHALFPDYNQAVADMGIPFFQALGNHDMDYRQGGDETSDKTFKEVYGPTYYSFNRGKAHYVVMDNVRYLGTERDYDGYITDNQLAWLAKDLKYVAKDQLLVINLHIPVHNAVKNNAELYALLEGYKNVHIMSGHTHYNLNKITNGIYEHNHGTVCGAWWTGPICEDGTPRGYGVYEVNGTDMKWYYKSTGFDKTKQVNVYVEELTNQKRIIANVWNWDPEWKVEYFLDDQPMGVLEQQKGYDPLAVQLYKGDKLPVTRSFAEPKKMDHLFIAHFSPSVKSIKVIATDRFGEKYTTTLNA